MITVNEIEKNLKNLDYLSNGDVIASIDTKNSQYWFYITTSFYFANKDLGIIITDIEVEKRF